MTPWRLPGRSSRVGSGHPNTSDDGHGTADEDGSASAEEVIEGWVGPATDQRAAEVGRSVDQTFQLRVIDTELSEVKPEAS